MSPQQQRQQRWRRHSSSNDDCPCVALEFDVEFRCRTEGALAVRATFSGSVKQQQLSNSGIVLRRGTEAAFRRWYRVSQDKRSWLPGTSSSSRSSDSSLGLRPLCRSSLAKAAVVKEQAATRRQYRESREPPAAAPVGAAHCLALVQCSVRY